MKTQEKIIEETMVELRKANAGAKHHVYLTITEKSGRLDFNWKPVVSEMEKRNLITPAGDQMHFLTEQL